MSEEQFNKEYITDKIQGICQDCMYLNKIIPIVLDIVKEAYKSGLVQAEIDNTMGVIEENSNFKSRINKTIKLIDITIETIKMQPSDDDTWILERLNGFKKILRGVENE